MKGLSKLRRSTHQQPWKQRRPRRRGRSLRLEVLDKRLLLAADLLEPNNSIGEVDCAPLVRRIRPTSERFRKT